MKYDIERDYIYDLQPYLLTEDHIVQLRPNPLYVLHMIKYLYCSIETDCEIVLSFDRWII